MNRKMSSFALDLILMGLLIGGCSNAAPLATTVPSVTLSPMPSATPTRTAAPIRPTLLPSQTPTPIGGSGGEKIAYGLYPGEPGKPEIFVMNTDGSGQTNLTNNSSWDCCPAWSPDGTKIVFTSGRDDGNGEIYVMNADGSDPTRLTFNDYLDRSPAWSPDGTKIVFAANKHNDLSEIKVMNADGGNQITLLATSTPDEGYYDSPSWSPDGAKIAFVREGFEGFACQGCSEIFVMDADGSNPIQITDNNGYSLNPAWSPDGTKIAYATGDGIVVMNPDGSDQTRVANTEGQDLNPDWSPDGRMIVFQSGRDYSAVRDTDIYIVPVLGGDVTRLTRDGNSRSPAWLRITQTAAIPHPDCTSGWSRLTVASQAKVSEDSTTPNRVRSEPSKASDVIALLPPSTVVEVLEGPVCADGLVFWKVESELIPSGVGWTAEGTGQGVDYYLEPYAP